MTKRTISSRAVPPLRLSERDATELRVLSQQLQLELLSQYEDFRFRSKHGVDPSRWKLVRSKQDLHAYTEQTPKLSHACTHKPLTTLSPHDAMARASRQPRVLVTGTLVGSLQDAMYGSTFQDTPSYQAFWESRPCPREESAVVATLERASLADPFRFLGVTWSMQSASVRAKRKHARDYLTLVTSGLTNLGNGEQVGIVITHSIQHPDLVEMHELQTLRSKISTLTVYRQLDAQQIEVWSVHMGDAKGGSPRVFRHPHADAVDRLAECWSVCGVGLYRKLRWRLHRRRLAPTATSEAIEPTSSGCNDACELCGRSNTKLFARSKMSCQLCYKQLCSRCSVSLELVSTPMSRKPAPERATFCIECMLATKSLATQRIAQEELLFKTNTDITLAH